MVEVFKTNVTNDLQAMDLVKLIEWHFDGYKVNFDLEDRDHILRVEATHDVEADPLINILKDLGVTAEVLPDEIENIELLLCRFAR